MVHIYLPRVLHDHHAQTIEEPMNFQESVNFQQPDHLGVILSIAFPLLVLILLVGTVWSLRHIEKERQKTEKLERDFLRDVLKVMNR